MRFNVLRLKRSLALTVVAILIASGGAGLMLWGIYQSMSDAMGSSLGAFFTGLIGVLSAGIILWIAHLIAR